MTSATSTSGTLETAVKKTVLPRLLQTSGSPNASA